MTESRSEILTQGLGKLIGSQVFTRLATFGGNQLITRAITVESYGLLAVKFHLINTSILMVSREGFRRGCLRVHQEGGKEVDVVAILRLASLSIPFGACVTILVCFLFWPTEVHTKIPGYTTAVLLQGAAAILELFSEPLYILAQAQLEISLRVYVEATATAARIVTTLLLLHMQTFTEAVALSIAQVLFAATVLLGYVWHFSSDARTRPYYHCQQTVAKQQAEDRVPMSSKWRNKQAFQVCCSMTGQAVEKLMLAEGAKAVMARVQSAHALGVYGLVINLGSIVVRTLFQPFEEAAFMAFSQPLPPAAAAQQRLRILLPLVRLALLFGGLATAFGCSNSELLLHILYGSKYSSTEAPAALAAYCCYIVLLAANGILECFVHAVSKGSQLLHSHVVLLLTAVCQMALTLWLVRSRGTLGMIFADAVGMLLRISYCCWFIAHFAAQAAKGSLWRQEEPQKESKRRPLAKGTAYNQQGILRQALPSSSSVLALITAGAVSAASAHYFLNAPCTTARGQLAFWTRAVVHCITESVLLSAILAVFWRSEQPLIHALKLLRVKAD